jgi:hypothetical protein
MKLLDEVIRVFQEERIVNIVGTYRAEQMVQEARLTNQAYESALKLDRETAVRKAGERLLKCDLIEVDSIAEHLKAVMRYVPE